MKLRALITAAVVALVATGLAACGGSSSSSSGGSGGSSGSGLTNLTVGYTSEGGLQIPSYVASDLGFFKRNGLNVKLVNLNSSTSLIPALNGGSVDIGTGDGAALCAGYLSGSQISVVGANLSNFTLEGWSTNSVSSIKQLAGKTVGVTAPGSTSDFALTAALQANHMTRSQVKVVYLHGLPATIAALTRGSIQATFIVPPLGETLPKDKFHRFYDTSSIDHVSTPFAAESSFLSKNQTAVKEYLKAMQEAVAFSADKSNKSKIAPLVSRHAAVPAAAGQYAFTYFQPLWEKSLNVTSANWKASCDEAAQNTKAQPGVDPQKALSLSLLPQ